MLDSTRPTSLFPIFAFLGCNLVLVSLPWHMQVWNVGTCAYMFWTATACLIEFVNSIVWRDHAIIVAPVWCDICTFSVSIYPSQLIYFHLATKLLLGAGVGIPTSSSCICCRLYEIASAQTFSWCPFHRLPPDSYRLFRNVVISLGIFALPRVFPYLW